MAGGAGSRFWPVSREARPKQFLDILGVGKTFLQQTYERFLPLVPAANILVVTHEQYREIVEEQLPDLAPSQILGEPMGRNTAPCIAYAAFRLRATDPDAVMIVTPADHLITGEEEFAHAINESVAFARTHDAMMTIGITPTRPDTGYGYIQVEGAGRMEANGTGAGRMEAAQTEAARIGAGYNEAAHEEEGHISKVKTFTEKPTRELAQVFIDSGEFLWNSGIFVWRTGVVLDAFAEHLSEVYHLFDASAGDFGTPQEMDTVRRIYPETRNISIDFGVIEKAGNVYVRRSDFGWSDVGTWNSLYANTARDSRGNAVQGRARLTGTTGSMVSVPEGKLAVVEGLTDYIVVDTEDVLFVWPRENEQDIKQVVNTLRFETGEEYL
jgi:mannose-1-phosphate guanylyltransferase